jgi:hypothetical protein
MDYSQFFTWKYYIEYYRANIIHTHGYICRNMLRETDIQVNTLPYLHVHYFVSFIRKKNFYLRFTILN